MAILTLFLITNWTMETVITGDFLSGPIIALDSSGAPYILTSSWRSSTLDTVYLFLCYKNGDVWVADTFEINARFWAFTTHYDLEIDRFNRIWTVYAADDYVNDIALSIVAKKDSTGWVKDTVSLFLGAPGGGGFIHQAIACDTAGNPHIVYDSSEITSYAHKSGGVWQKTMVDSILGGGVYFSIDIDTANKPHTSYFKMRPTITHHFWICHAHEVDNIWHIEVIDSSRDISYLSTSIAIDRNNLIGIAYTHPATLQVRFAYYDGFTWDIDTASTWGGILTQKSLDIDSLGQPYIVYGGGYSTWLAYKDASGWHIERFPPPMGLNGYGGSVRIGKDGTIHIARVVRASVGGYGEIHYIYGTITGVQQDKKRLVKDAGLRLIISPSVVRENARIQFLIPERQRIRLSMYDILGRKIATIADGIFECGIHCYDFTPSNLRAGIYFLVLANEKETITEKILIVR